MLDQGSLLRTTCTACGSGRHCLRPTPGLLHNTVGRGPRPGVCRFAACNTITPMRSPAWPNTACSTMRCWRLPGTAPAMGPTEQCGAAKCCAPGPTDFGAAWRRYGRSSCLGGEAAQCESRARVALALLTQALGPDSVLSDVALLARFGLSQGNAQTFIRNEAARGREQSVDFKHGPPGSTSLPLFAIAGVGKVSYEGEAAAWLEAALRGGQDRRRTGLAMAVAIRVRPSTGWRSGRPLVREVHGPSRGGLGWQSVADRCNQFHQGHLAGLGGRR